MKKISKTLFATLVFSLLIVCVAHAQTNDTLKAASVQEKAEAIAARMERELLLTKKQTKQVSQLATQRINNLKKRDGSNTNSIEAIDIESTQKLSAILTEEQFAEYKALRADLKNQRNEHAMKGQKSISYIEDIELDF